MHTLEKKEWNVDFVHVFTPNHQVQSVTNWCQVEFFFCLILTLFGPFERAGCCAASPAVESFSMLRGRLLVSVLCKPVQERVRCFSYGGLFPVQDTQPPQQLCIVRLCPSHFQSYMMDVSLKAPNVNTNRKRSTDSLTEKYAEVPTVNNHIFTSVTQNTVRLHLQQWFYLWIFGVSHHFVSKTKQAFYGFAFWNMFAESSIDFSQ